MLNKAPPLSLHLQPCGLHIGCAIEGRKTSPTALRTVSAEASLGEETGILSGDHGALAGEIGMGQQMTYGSHISFPALKFQSFRFYVAGQTISSIGTFIQITAMSWLVYRLTHSEFMLGLVGFVGELPGIVVALFAGILVDRVSARRVVLVTQSLAMLQALLLGMLVACDRIDIPTILLLAATLGMINGFDVPARQVLVLNLVPPADLRSAVALTSLSLDTARIVGAAVGGVLIATLGEGVCFFINSVSFAAVIVALLAVRPPPEPAKVGQTALASSLMEGITYVFGLASIRSIILLVASVSFFASPFAVLLPIMAGTVLEGGPQTLGALAASTGVGALTGAILLATRSGVVGLPRHIAAGAGSFGLGLLCFACSKYLPLSMASLAVAGAGVMILMTSSHTFLLSIADQDKRGRVMSIFTLSFMGTVPVGSLGAGVLASKIGTPQTLAAGAALCLVAALVFTCRVGRKEVRAKGL